MKAPNSPAANVGRLVGYEKPENPTPYMYEYAYAWADMPVNEAVVTGGLETNKNGLNQSSEEVVKEDIYFGDDYCIKSKKVTRKTDKSNVLRQYKRPAGKVKISESVSISNTFSASGGVTSKILNAQLGYNVTKTNKFSISWSNTYKYPVTITIYPIYSITTGEVWEKDLFFDDHVGNFTAKKAIGDDIVVKQRKTKK